MNLARSRSLPAALLIAAAGCGGGPAAPPATAPLVVAVSPGTAHVSGCLPTRLEARVSGGPAGSSRAVTWVSRQPGIVAVDETGLLTATGWGDTWIVARSVADPQVSDSASVTTRATTPTLTIRIDRMTSGADSVEVSADSVAGVIDVALVVDGVVPCAGLDRVELTVDGRVAGTRPAQATAFTRIVPVDTRALDPLTGLPRWPDGPHVLRGVLYRDSGEKVATPAVTLTFVNGDLP